MTPTFNRYIGIDYSGAETANSSLKGLRVYEADRTNEATEVEPLGCRGKYWTRRAVAEWLVGKLSEAEATIVGIDHGFSFPLKYFEKHKLPHEWSVFLTDFRDHWPTDDDSTYVDFVREGVCGNALARSGDSRWRRRTEVRAGAKSVFHFDVPGSVAKSTHAGIPWLLHVRNRVGQRVHFWPFDDWAISAGSSAVVEVYPGLWSHSFPRRNRTPDQHDAYSAAEWLRRSDVDGALEQFLDPNLDADERRVAKIEGWILGIA
jgi:hypothetical protein